MWRAFLNFRRARTVTILYLLAFASAFPRAARAQTASDAKAQTVLTQPHPKGWWPRDGGPPLSAYVGERVCAECHREIATTWQATQMAQALKPAAESEFLQAHPHMSYQRGPYTYRIDLDNGQAVYSMTGRGQTLSIPLLWAYGTGVVGQAFVFRVNGTYYEAEAAYYPVEGRLSLVAGLEEAIPKSPVAAFGLPLSAPAAEQCISCHTTAAVTSNELDVTRMTAGVSCEACHGPGARHAAAMQAMVSGARPAGTFILNPAKLAPVDLENFCGSCHRTSLQVTAEDLHGLDTVHYEPYRLEMSQCWIMTNNITCVTCHDPHKPLDRKSADYDSACLSCHLAKPGRLTASHPGRACPVATHNCASCHMPKCHLPLSPFTMSDHFIRIVRPGDPCSSS